MTRRLNVLVVEDSLEDTFFIIRELQRGGVQLEFERVETRAALEAALRTNGRDLILCDYSLPQLTAIEALALYKESGLDIPFIIVSGVIGEDPAVELIKAGAHDCVLKTHLERLSPAVNRELEAAAQRRKAKATEAALAYLASIVQSCDDAIVGYTLDGTIVSWNAGAEKLFGYSAIEIIGSSIAELYPAFRPEEPSEITDRIKRGEHPSTFETVRLRKDRRPVEVSLTVSPIRDAKGRIIGASTVARDITQRKREEVERLSLIQDLTSALSHTRI